MRKNLKQKVVFNQVKQIFVEKYSHLPLKQKRLQKFMQKCGKNTKFKEMRLDKANSIGDSKVCGMQTEINFCPVDDKD
jgi:hypothetical protein